MQKIRKKIRKEEKTVFNLLSDTDKQLIKNYIKAFVYSGSARVSPDSAEPLEHILRFWSENKKYLYQMFGNNFILEQPVIIARPEQDIENELCDALGEIEMSTFVKEFGNLFIDGIGPLRSLYGNGDYGDYYTIYGLASSPYYLTHPYDLSHPIHFPLPNGKGVKFEKGCNIIRMLGKIARAYGIDSFENFRLKHSQILNNKNLSGDLCLSIHPLDFMTMSDNDCDWDTCMSWQQNGCYRSGTVECMNSSCVIVAYLKSKFDMSIPGGTWNSKKWRSLFIVKDNVITSIKGYPYLNLELNHKVLEWLRELSGREYGPVIDYQYDNGNIYHTDDSEDPLYSITFTTEYHHMYNDFGCQEHSGIFCSDEVIKWQNGRKFYEYPSIRYAGPLVCLHCGSVNNESDNEEELLCAKCSCTITCACCGEYITGDVFTLDEYNFCSECYNDCRLEDPISGEDCYEPRAIKLFLVPDGIDLPDVNNWRWSNNPICHYIYIKVAGNWYENRDNLEHCDKFKCNSLQVYQYHWSTALYVRPSDLTEAGFKMFEETLEYNEYDSFEQYYEDCKI